jgi:magnesium-transporting ATPase (P-type)
MLPRRSRTCIAHSKHPDAVRHGLTQIRRNLLSRKHLMSYIAQFFLSGVLIAAGSAVMLLWLFLVAISYGGQSGLMPWVAAGVIPYGVAFVAVATVVCTPGILWAWHLARSVRPRWHTLAKAPSWIGTSLLLLGLGVLVAGLTAELLRPKPQSSRCVSYRHASASAAMAASVAGSIPDCPAPN